MPASTQSASRAADSHTRARRSGSGAPSQRCAIVERERRGRLGHHERDGAQPSQRPSRVPNRNFANFFMPSSSFSEYG